MECLLLFSPESMMYGITIIRIGVGLIFTIFGYQKLKKGKKEWVWLGQQMGNLGISFAPLFWGICAMLTEFVGGICLVFGMFTRGAASLMSIVMIVAIIHHISNGDPFDRFSFPLTFLIILIGLIVAGSGMYAMDICLMAVFDIVS